MNCKPGDLAVIVRSHRGRNVGRIVTVVRQHDPADSPRWLHVMPGWVVSPVGTLVVHPNAKCTWAPDAWLRPIRPDEGQDEMLRIAGRPVETEHA
jgi:hypothetical protein